MSDAEPIKLGVLFGTAQVQTRLPFGTWTRRGWMGPGYLVARAAEPELGRSHRVARFGED